MGVMTGIRKESGILDNSPLIAYLHNIFTEYNYDLKRKVVFSCADANRGIYVTFNETNPDPIKAIISSASIPFASPTSSGTSQEPKTLSAWTAVPCTMRTLSQQSQDAVNKSNTILRSQ